MSICRGGQQLAKVRHNLDAAGLSESEWLERWRAERLFLTADGDASQLLGNLAIRWHPDEHRVETVLPQTLTQLANRPRNRYRLSCEVEFPHRGDEVAAQTVDGSVRYDISFDATKRRWHMDASWRLPDRELPTPATLQRHRVLAVDLNADHLAAIVVDESGNPVGQPITVPVQIKGLPATTRDGRLRAAIFELIHTAKQYNCQAFVMENLNFQAARELGRERTGNRPSRGRRGRAFRGLVSGIPTAKFLVIDEIGYKNLDAKAAAVFFDVISARYETASVICSSNKGFGDWGELMGDNVLATAILDRLLHHCVVVNIKGDSYRLKDRAKQGTSAHLDVALAKAQGEAIEEPQPL